MDANGIKTPAGYFEYDPATDLYRMPPAGIACGGPPGYAFAATCPPGTPTAGGAYASAP